MRVNIVFGLLLVLFLGTGAFLLTRDRAAHTAPAPPLATAAATTSSSASAATSASAAGSGSASAPPADAGPQKLMDRPLRAVVLGWDLAAPAVLANGGLDGTDASDFAQAGVPTQVKPVEAMSSVEGALARGGGDKDGADVAIVPFCALVASYERLRALSPEAFFVVGWSRGREAIVSARDALPSPDDKPKAKPSADGKGSAVEMIGTIGEPATFLGLFALDANGIPASGVHLAASGTKPEDAPLAAVDRDAPNDTGRPHILLTTADASRLLPFVAVAQHGLLEKNGKALAAFTRVWLEAQKKLDADPPAAARTIAGAPGAPEPIALLKRLGQLAPASLGDNARAFGLSGRGALVLPTLFQETWRIWRAAGAVATPAPEAAPINDAIVTSLVRSNPALAAPAPEMGIKRAPQPEPTKALIVARQPEGKIDDAALRASAGLLADVFERSTLRVSVAKGTGVDAAATKKVIDDVVERFGVPQARLVAAKKAPPRAGAAVEILAAP
jgi:hypothetical protein